MEIEILAVVAVGLMVGLGVLWILTRQSEPAGRNRGALPPEKILEEFTFPQETGDPQQLDPDRVQPKLRDLLPLVSRWGVADDHRRRELQQQASAAEKQELASALNGRLPSIYQWLNAFNEMELSQEAAGFAYLLVIVGEMKILPEDARHQRSG